VTQASERATRIALMLIDVVADLYDRPAPHAMLTRIRGIALRLQVLKMSPAAFDCPNGRDAMAAAALTLTQNQLYALATGNAYVLSARWSKVVYIAGLELPGPGLSLADRQRAADMPMNIHESWSPAKIWRIS